MHQRSDHDAGDEDCSPVLLLRTLPQIDPVMVQQRRWLVLVTALVLSPKQVKVVMLVVRNLRQHHNQVKDRGDRGSASRSGTVRKGSISP